MNAQITPKEWQKLSEYLDGQLSPRDRSNLEQRLQTRPELREGLEELRRLRAVLRTVPRRKVPHNFTLTRAMVEKPAAARWFNWVPALSLSSAMAAFLLVISFFFRLPVTAPAAMVSSEMESSRVMMVEPEAKMMQDAAEAPPIIVWGSPGGMAEGRGGMGGGSESAMSLAEPEVGMMAAPEAEMYEDESMPPPEERAVEPPVPSAEDEPVEAPAIAMAPEALVEDYAEPLEGTGPILGIAPVEEQGAMQLKSAAADSELGAQEQRAAQTISPWLILQIGLALIAVGAGLSALYLKRKSQA